MYPLLVNDAINGKPVLRFDGVDDFLEVADSDSVSITGDITTFFVVKIDDFASYRAVWAKTVANQPAPNDWYTLPSSGGDTGIGFQPELQAISDREGLRRSRDDPRRRKQTGEKTTLQCSVVHKVGLCVYFGG